MTIKEYIELAKRTKKEKMNLNDIELGLIGEFGELVDVIKKIKYHNHSVNDMRDKLIKEAGDFLWYFSVYCDNAGIKYYNLTDRQDSVIFNIKYIYHNLDNLLFNQIFDMSGVFSSFCQILSHYSVNINDVMTKNIEKLKERYPDKYTDNDSINRSV